MDDDTQRLKELERAGLAKAILDNSLVTEALDSMEKDVIAAWENTQMRDEAAREKAWLYYIAVRKFRNNFIQYIETGKLASMQLEQKKAFRSLRLWR